MITFEKHFLIVTSNDEDNNNYYYKSSEHIFIIYYVPGTLPSVLLILVLPFHRMWVITVSILKVGSLDPEMLNNALRP